MFDVNCYTEAEGIPIAKFMIGRQNNLLCITQRDERNGKKDFTLNRGAFEPRLNPYQRSVAYIAGPSGSGKTTYALNLIKSYIKIHPEVPFFLFSRTDYKKDPAYQGLRPMQVTIDDSLLTDPINIENELSEGAIILFDDCTTIRDDKLRKEVEKLMEDIMEVGRKLNITIVISNHLVIPNDKKFARTVMNELQTLTVFPKSGSSRQIRYALKEYFGLDRNQIEDILHLPSRWVTISKSYPMYVLSEKMAYIL